MTKPERLSLIEHLGAVPDPRMARTQRHELLDILAIALCAVIGGADHWTEVVEFDQAKQQWFAGFLKLPNGIPSHDTFARVFRLINTEALEQTCHQWLRSLAGRVQGVVAIDGKSVRGAREGKKHPLHIVSAWSSENSMLLGQVRTAEKSNEITAIAQLLKLLDIQGCIVTIDAMGCQKAIAKEITQGGADYVLGLKQNHRHLCLSVASWFDKSLVNGFATQAHSCHLDAPGPSSHGRIERREHWVVGGARTPPKSRSAVGRAQDGGHGAQNAPGGRQNQHPGQLLPQQSGIERRCPRAGQSSAQPLGGGERAALVAGCRIQGGRLPSAQRQRTRQPGLPATHGADPAQAGDRQEAGHSRQAQARRLGLGLFGDGPQNGGDLDAIAVFYWVFCYQNILIRLRST